MSTGPKQGRGGARPGSGAKRVINDAQVKALLKSVTKFAKQHGGDTVGDILAGIIYDTETGKTDRLRAIKLFYDVVVPKVSENIVTKNTGPSISLPEMRPDPAKVVHLKAVDAN